MTLRRIPTGVFVLFAMTALLTDALPHPGATSTEARLAQEIVVRGWRRDRTLWLDPERFLELDADEASATAITLAITGARIEAELGRHARLWRCDSTPSAEPAIARARRARPDRRFAEALRIAPTAKGSLTAFPGGVIVRMRPDLGRQAAMAWLHDRGLRITQELAIGGLAFTVASSPGLAALEVANDLQGRSEIVGAMPVLWLDMRPQ